MCADTPLTSQLMACAGRVRERYPRRVAGTTVVDVEALAADICASLQEFPLTGGVLGCTVFMGGLAHTGIREGLRRDSPARYRFTLAHELSEILLRRYLNAFPDQACRERICDAFAAELLLPRAAVSATLAVLAKATDGTRACPPRHAEQLARRMAFTYGVSIAAAHVAITQCCREEAS